MHILPNAIIKSKYEVIVVGAGIGGLTAASLLAKRGVDVLCIEQHYMPGGCCGAIRRQDITMDVGATILYGFGERGLNTHRFVMNELEEEIDMIPRESIYNMHVGDQIITYWLDFKKFYNQLLEMFPGQKDELKKFYDSLYKLYGIFSQNDVVVAPSEMSPLENIQMLMKNPSGIIKLSMYMYKNALDLFKKYFTDPEIIAFFDMLTRTFSYVDSIECPALLSATMFTDNHEGGAYYPSGSPQMLPNKLEKSIEKYGGAVLYRNMVDEILIQKGRVYGVRLADGTEIMGERVVADATVWNIYGKLVKPEHIKSKRMKWAHNFIPCHSNMILYIGYDARGLPGGIHPMEIYIDDMEDVSGHGVTVYFPTIQNPEVSPPGKISVTVTAVSNEKWPRPWDPEYQSEEYNQKKQEEAEKLLVQIEKHIPDFRKHILFMEIATPSTMERYTLKNWGNVGGPKQALGQEMLKRLHARSDWKNLYQCGDSTVMGLGVLPATMSGISAANMVLKDMKINEFKARKFSKEYVNIVKAKQWTAAPDPKEPITRESAKRIAKECQHCERAGCIESCPANIDLVGFFRRIESGNFEGALREMREMNPFAESCGYVCPAENLCEKNCYRLEFDNRAMRIKDMHKWISENAQQNDAEDTSFPPDNGRRVAVIGAGPAGLSCAYFLSRLGYTVDIMEKSDKPGGMLTSAIPPFRLPGETIDRDMARLINNRINFHFGKSLGENIDIKQLKNSHDAVLLAPGLLSGKNLEISGIENAKATDALTFLQSYRRENTAEVEKKVLIIGGGSVAADAAITAKECGAGSVALFCLESLEEMPCLPGEIREMKDRGIKIENCWGPEAISANSRMNFSLCKSIFDGSGRFCPSFDRSQSMEIDFDQLIIAIGQEIAPPLAEYLRKEFGMEGLIEIDEKSMQVRGHAGIFAGGDIVRGAGTVVQAVADGRRAAMGIDAFLNN